MAKSLLPREHGAYAEILLPMAAVLIAGTVGPTALLLSAAAVCGFLAHEPIAVLLGRRGERARVEESGRARDRLGLLALAGAGSAVAGLYSSEAVVWRASILPAALVAASLVLLVMRRERTTVGEIVVAVTLASAAIPIGVAAGLTVTTSVAIAAVWAVGATLATATVRGILLAAKLTRSWQPEIAIGSAVAVLAVAAALSAWQLSPAWVPLALCPIAFLSVGLGAFRPAPSRVRQIGWSIVGANLVTLVIVAVGV